MADYEFPLQAVQLGSNLAQQGFQRDLQRRQLAGQEADRALRARVAAQEMELNALKIDEYSNKVAMEAKRRAMLEVALSGFEEEMSIIGGAKPSTMREVAPVADAASTTPPRFPLDVGIGLDLRAPRGPGPAPMAIPERLQGSLGVGDSPIGSTEPVPTPRPEIGEAFLKHFGPVAALTGSNLDDVIRAATTLERQREEGALLKQKAAADIKRIESTTKVNEARVKQIEEGKTQKQPETLILLDAYDRAEAEGDQNAMQAIGQKLKLAGLDEIDKELMRAEVSAAKSNVLLALDKDKLNAELAAIEKKYREKQGSKKSSTAPKMRWEAGKGLVK